jgi:hypothetical protein
MLRKFHNTGSPILIFAFLFFKHKFFLISLELKKKTARLNDVKEYVLYHVTCPLTTWNLVKSGLSESQSLNISGLGIANSSSLQAECGPAPQAIMCVSDINTQNS